MTEGDVSRGFPEAHNQHETMSEKEMLDALDAQLTYRDWDKSRKESNLRRDCRIKGFPMLRKLGLIAADATKSDTRTKDERRSIAAMGSVLVNEGMHASKAAKQCGVGIVTLKNYCKAFGFELDSEMKRRERDTFPMCRQAIKLVNVDGLRISHAAEKLNTTGRHLTNSLQRMGFSYDARAIKINPIK